MRTLAQVANNPTPYIGRWVKDWDTLNHLLIANTGIKKGEWHIALYDPKNHKTTTVRSSAVWLEDLQILDLSDPWLRDFHRA